MTKRPFLSVLMTAYNRENYISEAIESVLQSTFSDFELIIVDDQSVDKTVEIARGYAQSDNRIRLFINEKNIGDYPNRNKAASYATGDYLMYLDSDDTMHHDGLEKCVSWVSQVDNFNFGMVNFFNGEKKVVRIESKEALRTHFLKRPFLGVGPGGTIIRRSFFESIKGYPECFGPSNDMFFNIKAVCETDVVLLPEEFHFYRKHEGQEINTYLTRANRYIYSNYLYYNSALHELKLPLSPQEIRVQSNKNKRRFLTNLFRYFLKTKDLKAVWLNIRNARFGLKDAVGAIFHF